MAAPEKEATNRHTKIWESTFAYKDAFSADESDRCKQLDRDFVARWPGSSPRSPDPNAVNIFLFLVIVYMYLTYVVTTTLFHSLVSLLHFCQHVIFVKFKLK
jgi:hypothetical protein